MASLLDTAALPELPASRRPRCRAVAHAALAALVLLGAASSALALDGRWLVVLDGRLVDHRRREVTLRGVNARVRGIFDVTFSDGRLPLELFVPARRFPAGFTVRCDGTRLRVRWRRSSGIVRPRCGGRHGEQLVEVAPTSGAARSSRHYRTGGHRTPGG